MWFKGEFETANLLEFTSASGALETTTKKNGDYGGKNTDNTNFRKDLGSQYATLYISGYFRWDGTVGDNWYVMLGDGAASGQFEVKTTTGSKLKITVNGVTYFGTKVLSANTWYKIEVRIYTANSGGWVHLVVDGTTDVLVTGIDSLSGSDTGIRYIKWQGTNSASVACYVDICTASDYMPYGIKISKVGFDVHTCADKDLVFSSELNTMKTFGSQNMVPNATAWSHNLGYVPMHLYAGYLSTKPTLIGLVGQNTPDNLTHVIAGVNTVTNDNNSTWAADALIYLFYDSL